MHNRLAMFLLMVLGLTHDVASSKQPSPPTAHSHSNNATNIGSNGTGKVFSLLYLDYGKVQVSFEVLYCLYEEFYVTASVTFLKIFLGVIAFSLAGLGGILVGSFYGILTAYTTRFTSNTGIVEPLVVFLYCNMAYLSAEMFNLSGIIALIACCFVMRPFVQANISCESEMTIKYFLNMWSRFNESLIFIFVGVVTVAGPQVWNWTFITLTVILCVVARVIAVVGLTFLTNKFHSVKLTKEDQFLFACSGLRGAVAFFLAFLLETDHFPEREIFVTAIITVIFFTVFVQNLSELFMQLLIIKIEIQFSDRYLKKWLIVGEGKMEEWVESGGETEVPSAVPSTVSMHQQLSQGQYDEIHNFLQNSWILLQRTRHFGALRLRLHREERAGQRGSSVVMCQSRT
ncbi:serine/arginine repetitive matrix protein 2 [Sarotherodon galilaeus]